jgi:D-alanyl-D-alanine endopeptidase (penicillin-binding protein 7)
MLNRLLTAAGFALALQAHAGLVLNSDRALVIDRDTNKVLYAKSADQAAPIASVTKLMTAMVLLDEKPDMKQVITITSADVDTLKGSSSRLPVGTRLTRERMLHLTLMSSENRAAHALARTSSRGRDGFIAAMNQKARALGMAGANFADPTGLSPQNRASALDLRKLLEASSRYGAIKRFSTETSQQVRVGKRQLNYVNSNPVVGRDGWDVRLSKTGFIREAGRNVVVGFNAAGRNLAVVLMGADSSAARTSDLVKVRNWVAGLTAQPRPQARAKASASPRGKAGTTRKKARRR